ncbi:TPA: ABC-three component system protein [Escherichia coli]|uniref:ABC-three component system protein n=1 Tax=Escherichia coli TaxID=562 RepID=UPI0009841C6C|nr:ABC-three component system protein [Escherichia coli]EEW4529274.1 hypothetical protein [Escherichia coli]EFG6114674.1 hypothetical protein [Escherichia coli]EFG7773355.1 hypothetical protein [Escherichia coli]EFK2428757.1 hypothetical protein [Escherichia coli]EFV6961423.1 hypothetical protein [Escherichia coli]
MEIFQKDYLRKAINSNASSSVCGFLYQFQRALFHIFTSVNQNSLVGVETLDDVATLSFDENQEVTITLEQDKYTGKDNFNPIGDRSHNLWHTLNIWLSNLNEYRSAYDEINFYLTTNILLPEDSLAKKISNTTSYEDVKNILSTIHSLAKNTKNEDIKNISEYHMEDLTFVIKRIKVFDASYLHEKSIDIRNQTIQYFQLHSSVVEYAEEIYEQLLGSLINKSFTKWENKEQAWHNVQFFRDQLHELQKKTPLVRYIDRDIFSEEFQHHMVENNDLNFIRQLANLELPESYIDEQLKSYFGFYAERVRLQNEGYVLPTDWESRERKLNTRWKNITQQIEIEEIDNPTPKEKAKFRKILTRTLTPDFKEKLGNYETNHIYFTHGHYHDLVNDTANPNNMHWYKKIKEA